MPFWATITSINPMGSNMVDLTPVIGVPANVLVDKSGAFPGTLRAYVNQDYLDALRRAGAAPVILPMAPAEDAERQLALVDGLLLTGGADVCPLCYGEQPARGLGDVYQDMDLHWLALARAARAAGMPTLGVCRGMQVLNVAFGGTLHQDLDSLPGPVQQHVQLGYRHAVSHAADMEAGSRLERIFGQGSVGVNSFHHQAVKDVAPGFRVTARARDGVVEGIETEDNAFVLGVQWHPEGMVVHYPDMLRLFRALTEACIQRGRTA
jgi:putative glutamine amidotransferase